MRLRSDDVDDSVTARRENIKNTYTCIWYIYIYTCISVVYNEPLNCFCRCCNFLYNVIVKYIYEFYIYILNIGCLLLIFTSYFIILCF